MVILSTLLVYLSSYFPPEKLWIFTTVGLVYPMLFFANCFYILLWLFQDVKWMIPSTLCVLIGWNYTSGFIGINGSNSTVNKEDINILSYNTNFFAGDGSRNGSQIINDFMDFMDGLGEIDILCVQEFNQIYTEAILDHNRGYKMANVGNKRTAIFTSFPIIDSGDIDFGTRTNSCVWADLKINDDTIRVFSTHLKSNNITKETDNVLNNIDLQQGNTWKGARNILSKYRQTAITRAEQAKEIKKHINSTTHPVIVAGDMNEPPSSYTYNLLCDDMKDAFREKASGIESTYGGRIPFLRIDYIFTSKEIDIIDYETYNVNFSDHYPIRSYLRVQE